MFWMIVKVVLLALYILSGLGVIVMIRTMARDLDSFVERKEIKYEPYSLSERVAAKIRCWINVLCPIWNSIMFLFMVFRIEEIIDGTKDELLYRQIFEEEEEEE